MRDEEAYAKTFPSQALHEGADRPYGRIQWKGTDVCMDVYCACGEQMHVDGDFCYHVKCAYCGATYECDPFIRLNPVDESAVRAYGMTPYLLDRD